MLHRTLTGATQLVDRLAGGLPFVGDEVGREDAPGPSLPGKAVDEDDLPVGERRGDVLCAEQHVGVADRGMVLHGDVPGLHSGGPFDGKRLLRQAQYRGHAVGL